MKKGNGFLRGLSVAENRKPKTENCLSDLKLKTRKLKLLLVYSLFFLISLHFFSASTAYAGWAYTYSGGTSSIKQTIDGGYIIGGSITGYPSGDAILLKIDGNGNVQWEKAYDVYDNLYSHDGISAVQQTELPPV
ncbi:MAG: hypothetical protein HY755_06875 [Nitrospirae bacterium]|nr:hypothetical protein [Nitrospirota bacterium]